MIAKPVAAQNPVCLFILQYKAHCAAPAKCEEREAAMGLLHRLQGTPLLQLLGELLSSIPLRHFADCHVAQWLLDVLPIYLMLSPSAPVLS